MSFFVSPVIALIVLVPLVACVVILLDTLSVPAAGDNVARKGAPAKPKKATDGVRWSERAVVFGTGGALVASAFALFRLLTSGASFGYFQLLRCVRVGMTDASLTLSVDGLRGIGATAAAAAFTWAAVLLARKSGPRVHASLLVALAGVELTLVADGALGLVAGLVILGVGAGLGSDARCTMLARVAGAAAACVLLGSAFFSWGIAGSWSSDDYTPELYPRFSVATKTASITEEGRANRPKGGDKKLAALSMATMGGAFVYLDESRAPWEDASKKIVHPPFFEEPIPSGMHSFRIHEGYGLDDHVLSHLTFEEGQNVTIVPVGATLSPRELKDQVDVLGTSTEDLPLPTRDGFGTAKVNGIHVATLAQWLFVLAAVMLALVSLAWGRGGRPGPEARARSLGLLACAAGTAYRVDFLGRVPFVGWAGLIALGAVLGFLASRAESDPVEKIAVIVRRLADSVLSFDAKVLDVPFRLLSLQKLSRGAAVNALVVALAVASLFVPGVARAAAPDASAGHVVLRTADGARGPLVLTAKGNELTGQFEIENTGKATLSVLRIAVRTDTHDVRAPVALTAKADQPLPLNLAPGGRLKANVTLSRNTHVDEVFAHVVVTTTDDVSGELAIGIIGHSPTRAAAPLGKNALSTLLVILVGGALLVLVLSAMRIDWAGRGAATASAAGLLVLGLLVSRFDPGLSRLEGNDGLSFIERSPLFPSLDSELFLAADGLALVVAICILLGATITLLLVESSKGPLFEKPLLLLAAASATGAVFSRDLLLFVLFFAVACALAVIVVRAASPPGNTAFGKSRAVVFLALVFIALAVFALHDASDRAFSIAGPAGDHTFSIAELARVSFAQKGATFLGARVAKSAFVVLVVAFAALAGVPPFHTFTLDAFGAGQRPTGMFAVALVRVLGLYGLVHVVLPVLPESSRWGAGGVAWLAVAGAIYAAVCAFAEKRIGRKLGYLLAAQSSFALLGFSSVTPQGVVALSFGIFSLVLASIAVSALFAFGVKLDATTKELAPLDLRARGGLAFAVLACAGVPAFPGFFCAFSAILGATARHPFAVIFLVVALAFIVAAAASFVPAIVAELGPPVPPPTAANSWAFFALFLAVVATGVFPATWLDIASNSIRDRASAADPPGAAEVALK